MATYGYICHGVTPEMTCRFNGACYGEICVAPHICLKSEKDMTDDDREAIARCLECEENGPQG